MPTAALIEGGLKLLQIILANATKSQLAPEIIADIQAAVDAVAKVHATEVTGGQLEALRNQPLW